ELGSLLEHHLRQALHPKTIACYLAASSTGLVGVSGDIPASLETIAEDTQVFAELARYQKSWDVTTQQPDVGNLLPLESLAPQCMVPILGRNNELIGQLVLGPRLSEEPYSGEDKRLLDSIAAQTSIALENIHLAETMAHRIEADRRTAQEMEIA